MSPRFDRFIVIGDSLSDTGNAGRFTNGPVWVEVVADTLGLSLRPSSQGGENHAVGGARLPRTSGPDSLRHQSEAALRGRPPAGRTLAVVWGGGNDLLAAARSPDPYALRLAAGALGEIVRDLAGWGVSDLLVPNLPDVGMTPAVRGYGAGAAALAGILSASFNEAAEAALASALSGSAARLHRFDVASLARQVAEDPASRGFRDVVTPCKGERDCGGHLFWDGIHPTTQAHARLAEAALAELGRG